MFQLSNEVIVGVITFLVPILFAVLRKGLTPMFSARAVRKEEAKSRAEKSREDTVSALQSACNKATIPMLRVLVPKLLSIGELPSINVVLDYMEKEESGRLKQLKKALLAECQKNQDVKETVQIAVANSPSLATELAGILVKMV